MKGFNKVVGFDLMHRMKMCGIYFVFNVSHTCASSTWLHHVFPPVLCFTSYQASFRGESHQLVLLVLSKIR